MRAAGFIALAALTVPASARGESWHVDLQALTDFPIDVGARVQVEGPLRLRLSTSLGVLPGPYVSAINDFAVAVGAYNQETADVIAQSLQSSLVWRTHLGWRPFARHGFTFAAGYGLVSLGGGASGASTLATLLGKNPPVFTGQTYNVSSILQMIDAEVGWEWLLLNDHLVVDADLGFAGTLAASSHVANQNPNPLFPHADDQADQAAANYLDATYTSYVFTPVATVAVGYRFF